MFEGRDVIIGEQLSKAIAPIHRQDGRERVELQRAASLSIAAPGRGGRLNHLLHS
jgi:hypothetical protein